MKQKKQKKPRIIVSDPIHKEAVALLKKSGFLVHERLHLPREAVHEILPHYDALICRTNTKVTKDLLGTSTRLRCIGLASTGYDQIDLEEASRKNIAVFGLPSHNKDIDPRIHGNFISTAEHTILLMLAALGNFYEATKSLKEGRWEKSRYVGKEAYKKTLGIIGLGRIGSLVADRARAFGMEIIAYDPYVSKETMKTHGVKKVSLAGLCKKSDIITIHVPKTPETISLLDSEKFKLMKKGVILINAARSEVVEKKALLKALKSGTVYRMGVDVFTDEPHGIEWDLVAIENVIPTPHIAGSTEEALRRISLGVAQSIINFFKKNEAANIINIKKIV